MHDVTVKAAANAGDSLKFLYASAGCSGGDGAADQHAARGAGQPPVPGLPCARMHLCMYLCMLLHALACQGKCSCLTLHVHCLDAIVVATSTSFAAHGHVTGVRHGRPPGRHSVRQGGMLCMARNAGCSGSRHHGLAALPPRGQQVLTTG